MDALVFSNYLCYVFSAGVRAHSCGLACASWSLNWIWDCRETSTAGTSSSQAMPLTQCGTWHAWRCPGSRADTFHFSCVCFYRHSHLMRLGTYTSVRRSRRPGLSLAWMATWSSVRCSPCTTSRPQSVWLRENAEMCGSSTASSEWKRCSIRWTALTPTRTCCPTSPWAARSGTHAGTLPWR